MMQRSGDTAYAELSLSVAKATEDSCKEGGGSPPTVIAETISKALKSPNPKTRYVKGKLARLYYSYAVGQATSCSTKS